MNVKFVMPVYLACVCVRSITPVTTHTHTHTYTHTHRAYITSIAISKTNTSTTKHHNKQTMGCKEHDSHTPNDNCLSRHVQYPAVKHRHTSEGIAAHVTCCCSNRQSALNKYQNTYKIYRVSITSFPDYKHLLQNYCTWNTYIYIYFKCNSISFFYNTSVHFTHVLLSLHGERLIYNRFLYTCSPTCLSVIVVKASVILAFKFVISGTGVENTLSITYRHKKRCQGE